MCATTTKIPRALTSLISTFLAVRSNSLYPEKKYTNDRDGLRGAVCRSRNSSINNPRSSRMGAQVYTRWYSRYAIRAPHTPAHTAIRCHPRACCACTCNTHTHVASSFTEKAREPAARAGSLARSRDGLSDLHARQVQRASRCITCLIHVSRIPGVTIPADFHNATRASHRAPPRRAVPCRAAERIRPGSAVVFFGVRDRSPGVYAPLSIALNACHQRARAGRS